MNSIIVINVLSVFIIILVFKSKYISESSLRQINCILVKCLKMLRFKMYEKKIMGV